MLQEYLDQLFDAFKEGICISDVEGTVVHLNRRHAEITGIPREEMLGHSVMEFVKRGRLDVVLNPEVMRTGQPATRVQTVSDGRKLILEANPVFDAQGKLVLCITFLRDVTMLSEMREQMSVQKELLEAFQQLSTAVQGVYSRFPPDMIPETLFPAIFNSLGFEKKSIIRQFFFHLPDR